MSYPINYPTPQNCNVQMFYGSNLKGSSINAPLVSNTWVKPKGASFVWFTLIGGGGAGADSDNVDDQGGGGSGAVTNCLMPAFLVPDQLRVRSDASSDIFITYQGPKVSAGYDLLVANAGTNGSSATGGIGGTASTKTAFAAAGLYQSVAGQTSTYAANVTASSTTFLSAGSSNNATVEPNYGYPTASSIRPGFFQMSPIMVGRGGVGGTSSSSGAAGGIGCGGGGGSSFAPSLGGNGGQPMAVIISW
jgi:hypothetical protein